MNTTQEVTPYDEPSEAVAARIGYLLKHVHARFQMIQQERLAPFGLSGRLLAVLVEAAENGPVRQQRLSARLGVDRTTMVALIDELEASGYVQRRSDPTDRRGRRVHVTTAGRRALAAGLEASDIIEAKVLESLPQSQRETFRIMLAKLA